MNSYSGVQVDSLKLACLNFLKDNINDITSEKPLFVSNNNGNEFNINLDTVLNEEHLKRIIRNNNLYAITKKIPDTLIVSNAFIKHNIDESVKAFNTYPWNKNISNDIFFNYLLPYKVLNEYPENWRDYFYRKYKSLQDSLLTNYAKDNIKNQYYEDPNEVYYKTVIEDAGKWFKYNSKGLLLTNKPGFGEIMCLKEGDCIPESYLSVYILRSLGIPAAVDFIPYWGSRNSGHSSVVFFKNGKMVAPSGRELNNPAKVFRISYKRQSLWSDSIKPFLKNYPFLLSHLKNDHWIDVTSEHTLTTDISYQFGDSINAPFAYICVMDNGQWKPIFWGKISTENKAIFRHMGCKMLYHIAIPENDTYKLIGEIIMINKKGETVNHKPDLAFKVVMNLNKVNNNNSWVRRGQAYALYVYKSNEWILIDTKNCTRDSIIKYNNVPTNGLFKLVPKVTGTIVERIFTYKKDKQIWW